jgi:hyperosmotically inducible periplasmic protein
VSAASLKAETAMSLNWATEGDLAMRSIKMNRATLGATLGVAMVLAAGGAWATDAGPRTVGTVMDDAASTASVKTKLTVEKDTKARQINVETQKGVVQLNGFVDSTTARNEAEKIAAGTDGVKEVRNNLVVRPADRVAGEVVDDAMITGKVDAALLADKRTSGLSIDVETHAGEVQLSGFVKSQSEKNAAVEITKGVKGVLVVKNAIDIR